MSRLSIITTLVTLFFVTGCVQFDLRDSLSVTNETLPEFTNGNLLLLSNEQQRTNAREQTENLLSEELDLSAAIEVALLNSPATQAMLAEYWASSSDIALSGSIPNPVFAFETVSSDAELEITRILSIGLLDLIRFPMLRAMAHRKLEVNQLALSANVVKQLTDVRNAWVDSVAAKQLADYAEQVFSSAEASAKLALNMQAIGNFSSLSRARQQVYYADAATNLTIARHAALASREALIRALGLTELQAASLVLPDRLPDIPEAPVSPEEVSSVATSGRLDVQMGVADLKLATTQQGIQLLGDVTDIEIAGISETVWKESERESSDGYELEIEIPIFKSVAQVRNRLNATSLAAANRLENITRSANSHLRESYSAYRSGYDIARHYRDEVVPLQQSISEENVLNYNGMIIGIFELLADSRAQISTIQSFIQVTQQFWKADAALRASMIGKPMASMISMNAAGGDGVGAEH